MNTENSCFCCKENTTNNPIMTWMGKDSLTGIHVGRRSWLCDKCAMRILLRVNKEPYIAKKIYDAILTDMLYSVEESDERV